MQDPHLGQGTIINFKTVNLEGLGIPLVVRLSCTNVDENSLTAIAWLILYYGIEVIAHSGQRLLLLLDPRYLQIVHEPFK